MGTCGSGKTSLIRISLFILCILDLSQLSPLRIQPINFAAGKLERSGWSDAQQESTIVMDRMKGDLDLDGHEECFSIVNGALALFKCENPGQVLWKSPSTWFISQALMADLNRDDALELVLVVTRPFKNWPVDKFMPVGGRISNFHDSDGMSCHLILIGWKKNEYREVWAGSALFQPLGRVTAVDVNHDGYSELLAIEEQYDRSFWWNGGDLTLWQWNGFGFSLIQRMAGDFSNMRIMHSNQVDWILAGQ